MPGIVIKSEEKRFVYGEVYAPLCIDTDGEAMTAPEIEKMAHNFLMNGLTNKIDVGHSYEESGCLVIESFIARKNDPDGFVTGAWVVGAKIIPDELWVSVKKGEINGFSFAGAVAKRTVQVEVSVAKKMSGETEKSAEGLLPAHLHDIDLQFDNDGNVVKGSTSDVLGHSHEILRTTATEMALDHSHRLILIENGG